ncbi:hypothetical protein MJO28_001874 [Puccinia striiformis f. sp. tritici]|uniref:Uncharacterized protein n=1 Tax=Puccinia striiformis f. sp. tritici TaxID=168172 RepID=A0ACC0EV88_9BASI|nr:hypothetical protein MJO28_001874 [Puccinia striiformis f. sp. tritici]
MGNQKKRRKETESPPSSGSISLSQSNEPTRKEETPGPVIVDDDSDVEPVTPSLNTTTHRSLSKSSKVVLTAGQEPKEAQRVHANRQSVCYAYFDPPILSNAKDKNSRRMLAYPCKACGGHTNRPIYGSSPTNLSKHVASCTKKQREMNANQKLAEMGVSGTGDIDPQEELDLARPFASLGETSHLGIIHQTVIKNLPKRRTISNDIAKLYTAVQESLIGSFKVVLRPFRSHKSKKKSASNVESNPNSDNDESDEEDLEDCEEQIGLTTQDSKEDGNNKEGDGDDDDNCSTINDSALAAELVNDDKVELEHDDVNNLSDEDEYN